MHPNPAYRQTPRDANLTFARERGFGILTLNGPAEQNLGPLAAHVPFVIDEAGATLDLHLVRSNPVARALETPQPALLAVSGPDAYISPDWYAMDHQVPTWNYVAVHLRGTLRLLPHEHMREQLDRLSAHFEDRLRPKPPWLTTKMPDEALDRMMRQIVPARMDLAQVDGTWKLNQNKPDAARLAAADSVAGSPVGGDPAAIARMMRRVQS
jgi:transcriptional regulator